MFLYKNCAIVLAALLGRFSCIPTSKSYRSKASEVLLASKSYNSFLPNTLQLVRVEYRTYKHQLVVVYELRIMANRYSR